MQPDPSSKPTGLTPGEVTMTADLVTYKDGSIVSRAIVKGPTGDVTILAFDEGQSLKEHTVAFDALVQVLEGEVEIRIAGLPHHLHGGEMILMPALQPHALTALKRFTMILTRIQS